MAATVTAADERRADEASTIGIIGCGRMGTALAETFAAARFPLLLSSRRGYHATELAERLPHARAGCLEWVAGEADVLVLATPINATCLEIAPRIRSAAAGKAVIDVSNPGFHRLPREAGCDSAAELIACALPGGAIVKALNCVSARQIPLQHGVTLTIPIAGDDAGAKATVSSILLGAGFEVADAGDLRGSRWIEGLAELLMRLGKEAGIGDAVGFRLLHLKAGDSGEKGYARR